MVHVMSEVKRYIVSWHMQGLYLRHDGDVVRFSDHSAALDAQRLRADTAEAELEVLKREVECRISNEVNAVEALAAAEQRIAKMSELLKKFFEFVEMAPVSSGVCCCGSDTSQANHGDHMAVDQWDRSVSLWGREIDAALNPNPEAESHE